MTQPGDHAPESCQEFTRSLIDAIASRLRETQTLFAQPADMTIPMRDRECMGKRLGDMDRGELLAVLDKLANTIGI